MAERDLIFGAEHTMHYTAGTLLSCTLEACMVSLTSVTPMRSIKNLLEPVSVCNQKL